MATKKQSPFTEAWLEAGRVIVIGLVTSVLVGLITIFSLPNLEFMEAVKSPITWIIFAQTIGLATLKDMLTAVGKGIDKGMHIEGSNTDNENLEKGLTRF